jgi:hypothetical protein
LIHRDIKAGNLLLTLDGKLKLGLIILILADFGVSAKLSQAGGRARTFIGTPYWMAPEVIVCDPDNPRGANQSYDDKSDIWSIGITTIEIAEKNPPLSDIHPMQALTMIAKTDMGFSKPKSFSKELVDFVNCCLIKDPRKRPSAQELLDHDFMRKASALPRQAVLKQLVDSYMRLKQKKANGERITEEDEDDVPNVSSGPAVNAVAETLKQAKNLISSFNVAKDNIAAGKKSNASGIENMPAPSISEFPSIISNVQDGISPIFEPVMLTTLHEILSADFLDGQYILLGTENGLSYLDIQKPALKTPIPIISGIRFRQIQVVSKYNVLIALSGKHDHIRQYRLESIRRLILCIEGHSVSKVAKSDTRGPIQEIAVGEQKKSEYDYLDNSAVLDDNILCERWSNDYIKIVNTRDTRSFFMEETESTAYLCILAQGITVFRWAAEPYDKFMKIKSFWVPETPKFVSMSHDGLAACELFVGYSSELNRVSIADSAVTELRLHREMKVKMFGKHRWQGMVQIPFTDAKLEALLRDNASINTTVNRKLAAISGPTLKRAHTIERYFLGTYHRLTKVVDYNSNPMVGAGVGGWKDGVMWSEPPSCQILRPLQHVISVGNNNIEIVDWKSAALRQRMTVDGTASFRTLSSSHGHTLMAVDKKRVGSVLYWMRESSSPPREPGMVLSNILKANAPKNILEARDTANEAPPGDEIQLQQQMAGLDIDRHPVATKNSTRPPPSDVGSTAHSMNYSGHVDPYNNGGGPSHVEYYDGSSYQSSAYGDGSVVSSLAGNEYSQNNYEYQRQPSFEDPRYHPSQAPPPRMMMPVDPRREQMPNYDPRYRPRPQYDPRMVANQQQYGTMQSMSSVGGPGRPPMGYMNSAPRPRPPPAGYQGQPLPRPIYVGDPRLRPRPGQFPDPRLHPGFRPDPRDPRYFPQSQPRPRPPGGPGQYYYEGNAPGQ